MIPSDHSKQAENAHLSKLHTVMESVVATAPRSRASVICGNEHESTGHQVKVWLSVLVNF